MLPTRKNTKKQRKTEPIKTKKFKINISNCLAILLVDIKFSFYFLFQHGTTTNNNFICDLTSLLLGLTSKTWS